MGNKISAWKFPIYNIPSMSWWEGLTIEQKVEEKLLFELKRLANTKSKHIYPNMYNLTNIRISQLSEKHIVRIHCFKDMQVREFK